MNRYLPWILAALVALPATAAAQDETAATDTIDTFALGADKPRAEAKPGGAATYVLYAKSRVEQTLKLGVEGLPDGYAASYSPAELKVGPGSAARTLLTIEARDGARTHASISFVAFATNEAGERHAVKLALSTVQPAAAPAFALKVEPEGARVEPNGTTKIAIHVRSAHEQTVSLSAHLARGSGYRFEVEPATVKAGPGAPGLATLVVYAGPDASSMAAIEVVGTNGVERHGAIAKVGLIEPTPQRQPQPSSSDIRITVEIPGREPIVLRLAGATGLRMLAGDDAIPGLSRHGRAWLLFEFGADDLRPAKALRGEVNVRPVAPTDG